MLKKKKYHWISNFRKQLAQEWLGAQRATVGLIKMSSLEKDSVEVNLRRLQKGSGQMDLDDRGWRRGAGFQTSEEDHGSWCWCLWAQRRGPLE